MFEWEQDDRPKGSPTFIFWTGVAIVAVALALAGALLVAAELLEDQEPGDQGWVVLAYVAFFVVMPFTALGAARMIWGALLWLFAKYRARPRHY